MVFEPFLFYSCQHCRGRGDGIVRPRGSRVKEGIERRRERERMKRELRID